VESRHNPFTNVPNQTSKKPPNKITKEYSLIKATLVSTHWPGMARTAKIKEIHQVTSLG
jgi:hypothetical protein